MTRCLLLCLAACGGAGLSADVRTDVAGRMATVQQPIATCYASALKGNRKLRGNIVLTFAAAPSTGEFTDITVQHDELGDPNLQRCVITEVSKLKLQKPQSTRIAVSSYPIHFEPTK